MKITIYELLGLIKDGKAPKKIIYNGRIWKYMGEHEDYYNDMWSLLENQIDVITKYFDEEVKILDEENEFIDIEEIKFENDKIVAYYDGARHLMTTNAKDRAVYIKIINDLIKNQKKIIERLNNEKN